MFNFMKKTAVLTGGDVGGGEERDGDKERRKREKKERKEREKRERIAAGLEEPLRLEEVSFNLTNPQFWVIKKIKSFHNTMDIETFVTFVCNIINVCIFHKKILHCVEKTIF